MGTKTGGDATVPLPSVVMLSEIPYRRQCDIAARRAVASVT